jgi:hypothetical protein
MVDEATLHGWVALGSIDLSQGMIEAGVCAIGRKLSTGP